MAEQTEQTEQTEHTPCPSCEGRGYNYENRHAGTCAAQADEPFDSCTDCPVEMPVGCMDCRGWGSPEAAEEWRARRNVTPPPELLAKLAEMDGVQPEPPL